MSKNKKNPQIAATQVGPSELIAPSDLSPPEHPEPRDVREFLGLSAELAQDTLYIRSSRWPGATEDFPHEPDLRTCEEFFKDAVGGPLYIDKPVTKGEVANCLRKAAAMRARGIRYVYIFRLNGIDPSIESVLAQLGDVRGVA